MTLKVTIFDIEENPLQKQPVELLQNGKVIAQTSTDTQGVANFNTTFTSAQGLTLRGYNTKEG